MLALILGLAVRERIRQYAGKLKLKMKAKMKSPSYNERMQSPIIRLKQKSCEIDKILKEINEISREKERTITKLEHELEQLARRQTELRDKISTLEKVPLPALEHFEKILSQGSKWNAKRDYILFGLGVVVSALISVLIMMVTGWR